MVYPWTNNETFLLSETTEIHWVRSSRLRTNLHPALFLHRSRARAGSLSLLVTLSFSFFSGHCVPNSFHLINTIIRGTVLIKAVLIIIVIISSSVLPWRMRLRLRHRWPRQIAHRFLCTWIICSSHFRHRSLPSRSLVDFLYHFLGTKLTIIDDSLCRTITI